MEFEVLQKETRFYLRNPDDKAIGRALLIDQVHKNRDLIGIINNTGMYKLGRTSSINHHAQDTYLYKARQGQQFLLDRFSRNVFTPEDYIEYVNLTKYVTGDFIRTNPDNKSCVIPDPVIMGLENIRLYMGFEPKLRSQIMYGEEVQIFDDYEFSLPGISHPVEVINGDGMGLMCVDFMQPRYHPEFFRSIMIHTNQALVSTGEEVVDNSLLNMQLMMHMGYSFQGIASRSINFLNMILIHKGFEPIEHGILDFAALSLPPNEFLPYGRHLIYSPR